MDWKTESTLNTYLVQQMKEQYAERSRSFSNALRSKDSLLAYAKNVRQKFRELLGDLPPASPLNARITGAIKNRDYTIEKIVYESFANHHVTANLYIPSNKKGKVPAALLFCGHEDVSKATESYQRTAILLALHGFAVMVIDPISQSERHQLTDAGGKPLTRGGTTEHTLINESANLVGTSAVAYELWDNVRGLDYLVTRPEIDTAKIGCIGNSGGAIQAIYFAAFDPRIKVMVPCSYLATRERTLELSGPADGCAQMPGEGSAQLEMADYLIAAAPKPVLVLAGRYDFIDYPATRNAFNDLQLAYNALGVPNKASLFVYDDGHGISKPKREAAVAWFKRWLMNDTTAVREPSFSVLDARQLQVTVEGQVNAEYPNEVTVFDRNRMLAEANRKPSITSVKQSNGPIQIEATGNNLILRKPGEPPLPGVQIPNAKPERIVIWFHAGGKHRILDSAALMKTYANALVLVCDVRGVGETEDKAEFNDPKYYNKEYRNAMLALHTGRSLVMQRATDMLTLLSTLKERNLPIEVHATDHLSISALHAALADSSITQLYLYHCIPSFKTILQNPLEKNWYSWVIPGVLKYYDIPDIVKLIGEDKVKFVQ